METAMTPNQPYEAFRHDIQQSLIAAGLHGSVDVQPEPLVQSPAPAGADWLEWQAYRSDDPCAWPGTGTACRAPTI